jgi:Zn-dependent protease
MRNTRISFSKVEKQDLLRAWIMISVAFAIVLSGFNIIEKNWNLINLLVYFMISAFTAGAGFVVHELAHKIVAIYHGCSAEFRANNTMLKTAIIISLFSFIFAAPGAVIVQGSRSSRESGRISAAGPASNLVLAIIFMLLIPFTQGIISLAVVTGALINGWLALFNMIPIMPFDGRKIWVWNKAVYVLMAAIAIVVTFGQNFWGGLL